MSHTKRVIGYSDQTNSRGKGTIYSRALCPNPAASRALCWADSLGEEIENTRYRRENEIELEPGAILVRFEKTCNPKYDRGYGTTSLSAFELGADGAWAPCVSCRRSKQRGVYVIRITETRKIEVPMMTGR